MRRSACLVACVACVLIPSLGSAHPLQRAPNCPVFPADNPWNERVDQLPVAQNSASLIASIGLDKTVHPDFGTRYHGQMIGTPIGIATSRTRKVPISFEYSSDSNRGPYPLPPRTPIEGGRNSGGDRHVIVVDRSNCLDYELWDAYPLDHGRRWRAGAGAIFNLRSDQLRPAGWTSADGAGLPILPGLARYDEVSRGVIDHALRFTSSQTRAAYLYPARHYDSSSDSPSLPPMGLRVRLKASVNISHLPYQARVIAQALKTYGMILADNGSPWFVSGVPSQSWNNYQLQDLERLSGRDFEVVDTNSLPHPGL